MAAGSLVVKIGADLNDFSSKLNKMTRDVRSAAQTMTDVGKSLTLGITLPVTLAGVALAKMGMENEAVGRKMHRVFGDAAERVNASLEKMMTAIPEAGTEMQKMVISLTEIGEGLGLANPQANLLAENLMKIAGQVSAAKMVPFAEALEGVEKAMMGQTRGLKQLGIVLDQDQIKNEAYRLGLLRTGEALTPLGTALATYSLLTQQSARFTGEAGAQAQDTARQWAFLKRDFGEFADATSNLLIPAIQGLVAVGRGLVDFLNWLPMPVRAGALALAAFAAIVGPTIIIVAKLTEAIVALRATMTLLAAGGFLARFVAFLANPVVIAGIAALTVAVVALAAAWKHFHKSAADAPKMPDLGPLTSAKELMKGLKAGATSSSTKDPFTQWRDSANAIGRGFDMAVQAGDPLVRLHERVLGLASEAERVYERQADHFSEMAIAAREVAMQMRERAVVISVATRAISAQEASRTLAPPTSLNLQVARQRIDDETNLRFRELRLRTAEVADGFVAARFASLQLGERFLETSRTFKVGAQAFKQQWANLGQSTKAGLQEGMTGLIATLGPIALAAEAFGAVLRGLQPFIDALFVPLAELGRIIGIMLTPILKILLIPLRALGIVVSFLGEIMARVSAGLATGIGKLLVGIGNLLNKLPGSIGNPIKSAGEGILSFAASQYEAADQLKKAREDLQKLQFNDAMNGVRDLGDAAHKAAEELYNLPSAFKVNLEKWRAITPLDGPIGGVHRPPSGTQGQPGTSDPYGAVPLDTPFVITLDERVLARATLRQLRSAAAGQFRDPSKFNNLSTI